MHERGSVEQFHGCAEGDEFLFGRAQHISHEQAQGRSDAFSSRREQMLESRSQVGVVLFAGLLPNPLLNELKLIVNRCKKGCRAQTLASPTEQTRSIRRSNF